jgi:predicted Zn finger-like uncharacterized protein
MILTCPSCSTRYFADEEGLGLEGRMVRCAACQHTWRARASDAPAAGLDEDADDEGLATALDADDPIGELAAPPPSEPKLPERPLAPGALNTRAALIGWAAGGAGVLALVTLAVLFRVEVVGLWPRMASAYAAVGFEVTAEGLVFEGVSAAPGYTDGEPTLTISASVRNTSGRVRAVPPVRIGLYDQDGDEVFSWAVSLSLAELQPRQTARFTAMLAQPPADAQDLELRFLRRAPEDLVPAATELVEAPG